MSADDAKRGVEALMARVKAQAAERRRTAEPEVGAAPEESATLDTSSADAHLTTAAERNQPPERWPAAFGRFPFSEPSVQRLLLGVFARLTEPQRAVDDALIAALRAQLALTAAQHERIAALERRLRALEARGD